jgi:ATP-dependent Clp protease ATP-binding subunit ClpA
MKFTRWTVALYMALVFACGGVVGAFAHRLYTVSGVSANAAQRNPEEFRKRFMTDMKARLQLNDDQAAKLNVIMDETRARFRDVREKFEPEMQKIREDQRQRISELLSPSQQAEWQKIMEERQRRREGKKGREGPPPPQ